MYLVNTKKVLLFNLFTFSNFSPNFFRIVVFYFFLLNNKILHAIKKIDLVSIFKKELLPKVKCFFSGIFFRS